MNFAFSCKSVTDERVTGLLLMLSYSLLVRLNFSKLNLRLREAAGNKGLERVHEDGLLLVVRDWEPLF